MLIAIFYYFILFFGPELDRGFTLVARYLQQNVLFFKREETVDWFCLAWAENTRSCSHLEPRVTWRWDTGPGWRCKATRRNKSIAIVFNQSPTESVRHRTRDSGDMLDSRTPEATGKYLQTTIGLPSVRGLCHQKSSHSARRHWVRYDSRFLSLSLHFLFDFAFHHI